MKWSACAIGAGCVLGLALQSAAPQTTIPAPQVESPAQSSPPQNLGFSSQKWQFPNRDQVNEGVVTIMTGPVGGLTPIMGSDLARVLDDGDKLRILPIAGKGSVQNIIDILYLKTIDMGFVVSDVMEFFKLQYNAQNIESHLRYIAKLYNNEIYIIAPTSIRSIYDLAGKKIMAPKDVGFFTARIIFSRLNIDATFDYQTDDTLALQKVIDGQADAWIVSVGKIFPIARNLKNEGGRLHLVPIPYEKKLWDLYMPSQFTSEEYPNLIPAGQTVDTLATGVILAVFNWPENSERYKRAARFTEAFFSKSEMFFKPPRNPKWKEMNIGAKALGWTRFKAAQDWLDRETKQSIGTVDEFRQFISEKGLGPRKDLSQEEVLKMYDAYAEWARNNRK